MIEELIFEKLRSLFIADSVLAGLVGTRVYTSHVSTITSPIYPAISFHLINSVSRPYCPEMVTATVQIDVWVSSIDNDKSQTYDIAARIRAILVAQKITDSKTTFKLCLEKSIGPEMFETNLYHLPIRYEVTAV